MLREIQRELKRASVQEETIDGIYEAEGCELPPRPHEAIEAFEDAVDREESPPVFHRLDSAVLSNVMPLWPQIPYREIYEEDVREKKEQASNYRLTPEDCSRHLERNERVWFEYGDDVFVADGETAAELYQELVSNIGGCQVVGLVDHDTFSGQVTLYSQGRPVVNFYTEEELLLEEGESILEYREAFEQL